MTNKWQMQIMSAKFAIDFIELDPMRTGSIPMRFRHTSIKITRIINSITRAVLGKKRQTNGKQMANTPRGERRIEMGASREGFDVWWSLFKFYRYGNQITWHGKRVFTRRFWSSRYVWHDSFGKYWNRIIGCRIFGHRHVQNISGRGEAKQLHCFDCERHLVR